MTSSPAPQTFGRRTVAARATAPAAEPQVLGEAAERFRAGLSSARGASPEEFSAWRRGRGPARLAAWAATFGLLTPGVVCFVVHAPGGVSTLVEVAGFAANWWLRRARRAHLAAIREWAPAAE